MLGERIPVNPRVTALLRDAQLGPAPAAALAQPWVRAGNRSSAARETPLGTQGGSLMMLLLLRAAPCLFWP